MPPNFFEQFHDAPEQGAPAGTVNYFSQFHPPDAAPPAAPSGRLYVSPSRPDNGVGDALKQGVKQGVTAGFSDELAGLEAAGGGGKMAPTFLGEEPDHNLWHTLSGFAKYLAGDEDAHRQYNETVLREREALKAAQDHHAIATGLGEVGGAIVTLPMGGEASQGAGWLARAIAAAKQGALFGGLQGVGEGEGAADTVKRGAAGIVLGGALGGVAAPLVEAGGKVAQKVTEKLRNTYRGAMDPEAEAARQYATAYKADRIDDPTFQQRMTPDEFRGNPEARLVDLGGGHMRRLADASGIIAPGGEMKLKGAIDDRFKGQTNRFTDWFRSHFNYPDAYGQSQALDEVAKNVNGPAYRKAYAEGDRPIMSDDLEFLMQSPKVQRAMKQAEVSTKDRSVVEGFGRERPAAASQVEKDVADIRAKFGDKAATAYEKQAADLDRKVAASAGNSAAAATPKGAQSLLEFLASKGGLGPDAELAAIGAEGHTVNIEGVGRRKLVKQGGDTLDYAREAATEAGYLPEGSTPRDMLDAIDAEVRGQKRYPQGLEGHVGKREAGAMSDRERAELDRHMQGFEDDLHDAGHGGLAPDVKRRAIDLMDKQGMRPDDAVDHVLHQLEMEDAAGAARASFPGDQRAAAAPAAAVKPTGRNLEFWDQTRRVLSDASKVAARKGAMDEADVYGKLAGHLNAELDKHVPSYQAARQGAAGFFGAEDALQAGIKFVSDSKMGLTEARATLAKMSPAERRLFQDGFVDEYLRAVINKTGDNRDVLLKIANNPEARGKLELVMGRDRMQVLEAKIRVEQMFDQVRKAVQGQSITAKRLYDLGMAGGAGLSADGGYNTDPKEIAYGAVVAALASGGKRINAQVASRLVDMMLSRDPMVVEKGFKLISGNPAWLGALRDADTKIGRVISEASPTSAVLQLTGAARADAPQGGDKRQNNQPSIQRPVGH